MTACGGGSGSSATSAATTSSGSATTAATATGGATANAAFAKYSACLRQHGVTLPARGTGGAGPGGPPSTTGGTNTPPQQPAGGAGSATFQKAQTACASLRPKGARAGGPGFGGGQDNAAFAAYRNCLTIHGVKASSLRPGSAGTATVSAKVKQAMTACASLRPAPANRPASTTTTPSQ
ncbi:MAG TPA: hypothetical protein VGK92_00375 [Gaiellales bacterium]